LTGNDIGVAIVPASLRPGLTLLPLGEDMVVFSEEAQCLIGLNPTAAFVFLELQRGTPASQVPQALTSQRHVALDEAERWVATALGALGAHGLLVDDRAQVPLPARIPGEHPFYAARRIAKVPPYRPAKGLIERRYRLLETRALIRFAHPAQMRLVDSVLGHLACDDKLDPTVVMEIQAVKNERHLRSYIYRNEERIGTAARLSKLAPKVKGALWQTAVNAHDFLFYIHAGVVGTGQSCILLPAAAGSGKSSLTAALTHSGFRYFSDEVALIDRGSFQVPPMPLAICSKSTGWDLMARYYPGILDLPLHGREDGKMVRYIPPPASVAQQRPASVSHIIFPRYEAAGPCELLPITRSEALGRLMAECMALREPLNQSNARELVEWIGEIDCYSLIFSSLDEAVGLVRKIVAPE
jgi:hypothetical protein